MCGLYDIVELVTVAAAVAASKVGVWERCCLDVGRVPMMIVATDATNTAQPSATAAAKTCTAWVWTWCGDDNTTMRQL